MIESFKELKKNLTYKGKRVQKRKSIKEIIKEPFREIIRKHFQKGKRLKPESPFTKVVKNYSKRACSFALSLVVLITSSTAFSGNSSAEEKDVKYNSPKKYIEYQLPEDSEIELLEDSKVEAIEEKVSQIIQLVDDNYKIIHQKDNDFEELKEAVEPIVFKISSPTYHLTYEEKLQIVLQKYLITEAEFRVIVAIATAEAKKGSYEDVYAVINTMYNRIRSYRWHRSVDNRWGSGAGGNLYFQATHTGQYVVYEEGTYLNYLNDNIVNTEAYKAAIDMLYSEATMHDYMSFRSSGSNADGREQFVTGGNRYFSPLKESDTIPHDFIVAKVDEKDTVLTLRLKKH